MRTTIGTAEVDLVAVIARRVVACGDDDGRTRTQTFTGERSYRCWNHGVKEYDANPLSRNDSGTVLCKNLGVLSPVVTDDN